MGDSTFTESTPIDTDFAGETDDELRALKQAIEDFCAKDHYVPDLDNDSSGVDGEHVKVTLRTKDDEDEDLTEPSGEADKIKLYSKEAGTIVLSLTWTADGDGAYATADADDIGDLSVGDGVSGSGISGSPTVTSVDYVTLKVVISDTAASGTISTTFENTDRQKPEAFAIDEDDNIIQITQKGSIKADSCDTFHNINVDGGSIDNTETKSPLTAENVVSGITYITYASTGIGVEDRLYLEIKVPVMIWLLFMTSAACTVFAHNRDDQTLIDTGIGRGGGLADYGEKVAGGVLFPGDYCIMLEASHTCYIYFLRALGLAEWVDSDVYETYADSGA